MYKLFVVCLTPKLVKVCHFLKRNDVSFKKNIKILLALSLFCLEYFQE